MVEKGWPAPKPIARPEHFPTKNPAFFLAFAPLALILQYQSARGENRGNGKKTTSEMAKLVQDG